MLKQPGKLDSSEVSLMHALLDAPIAAKLQRFTKGLNQPEAVFWQTLIKVIHNKEIGPEKKFARTNLFKAEHKIDVAQLVKEAGGSLEAQLAAIRHNESAEEAKPKILNQELPEYTPPENMSHTHGETKAYLINLKEAQHIQEAYASFMKEISYVLSRLPPELHEEYAKVVCERYLHVGNREVLILGLADKLAGIRSLPIGEIRAQVPELLFYGALAKNLNRHLQLKDKRLIDWSVELRSAYTEHVHPKIHNRVAALFKERFGFSYHRSSQTRIADYWGGKIEQIATEWAKDFPEKDVLRLTKRVKATDSIWKKLKKDQRENGKTEEQIFSTLSDFTGITVVLPKTLGGIPSKPHRVFELAGHLAHALTGKAFYENKGMKKIQLSVDDWKDRISPDSPMKYTREGKKQKQQNKKSEKKKDERLLIHFQVEETTVTNKRSYAFEIIIEEETDFHRHEFGDAAHDVYKNDNRPLAENYVLVQNNMPENAEPIFQIVALPDMATYEHVVRKLYPEGFDFKKYKSSGKRPALFEAQHGPQGIKKKTPNGSFHADHWSHRVLPGEYLILENSSTGVYPLYVVSQVLEQRRLELEKEKREKNKGKGSRKKSR